MIVVMTEDALANYGEQWRGVEMLVIHTARAHMPAKKFYAQGQPEGYHPGYDEAVRPMPLYDLRRVDNGEAVPFSLYKWEVTHP